MRVASVAVSGKASITFTVSPTSLLPATVSAVKFTHSREKR